MRRTCGVCGSILEPYRQTATYFTRKCPSCGVRYTQRKRLAHIHQCQLINPLCPDDLCVLPSGHEGYHKLGTMSEPMSVDMEIFVVSKRILSPRLLAVAGWRRAKALGLLDAYPDLKGQVR